MTTRPSRRQWFKHLSRVSAPLSLIATAVAITTAPLRAAAQSWPTQPVRIVVPYAAGGSADNLARALGVELARDLGQPVVVDNRPGAAGTLGTSLVARERADGYTLLLTDTSHVMTPSLQAVPYDALKDFDPIRMIVSAPQVLFVNPGFPAQTIQEYVALSRAQPDQYNLASGGTASDLAAELFKQQTGVAITLVPYRGGGQAMIDLVAGHVQSMIAAPGTVMPYIRSGAVRALATTGAQRSTALPDVPTMRESGIAGVEFSQWFGLLAPAGLPPQVKTTLAETVGRALQSSVLQTRLKALGLEASDVASPAQFAAHVQADAERWARVVAESKLRVDR